MPLTSRLFKGDPAFEAALVNDHAHITLGSKGNQVWKIQAALMMVMDPPPRIEGNELAAKAKFYSSMVRRGHPLGEPLGRSSGFRRSNFAVT